MLGGWGGGACPLVPFRPSLGLYPGAERLWDWQTSDGRHDPEALFSVHLCDHFLMKWNPRVFLPWARLFLWVLVS